MVRGEKQRFSYIITKLIKNGKLRGDGKRVRVVLSEFNGQVTEDVMKAGVYLTASITDTGPEMTKEE